MDIATYWIAKNKLKTLSDVISTTLFFHRHQSIRTHFLYCKLLYCLWFIWISFVSIRQEYRTLVKFRRSKKNYSFCYYAFLKKFLTYQVIVDSASMSSFFTHQALMLVKYTCTALPLYVLLPPFELLWNSRWSTDIFLYGWVQDKRLIQHG